MAILNLERPSSVKKVVIAKESTSFSYAKAFADNLKKIAPHVNVMDLEHGIQLIEDTATFCLEGNPAFLRRVRFNLQNITTKVNLQKYMYNSILRGENLCV